MGQRSREGHWSTCWHLLQVEGWKRAENLEVKKGKGGRQTQEKGTSWG